MICGRPAVRRDRGRLGSVTVATRDEMSRSFGAAAGVYDSGRPDYPVEAVSWMLEPIAPSPAGRRPSVADVGAGTGKLTRVVAGLAADVVAIDPDAEMLTVLADASPGITTLVGTAERLPLPDSSVDAVVLGQAWHWVDPGAGSVEAGRVLRPGGVLGLIWNTRDDNVEWVARLTEIMHPSAAEKMVADGGPTVGEPFGDMEARTWAWSRPMTRASLHDMVNSRSYVITADDAERARITREVDALLDEIGAIGTEVVEMPYITDAFRALRP